MTQRSPRIGAGDTEIAGGGLSRRVGNGAAQLRCSTSARFVQHNRGNHADAIGLFRRALDCDPAAYPAWVLPRDRLKQPWPTIMAPARRSSERFSSIRTTQMLTRSSQCFLETLVTLEAALRAFSRVVSLQPESAGAHNNLGIALHEPGRINAAQACYTKALALDPDLANAALNLGEALRLVGRHAESLSIAVARRRSILRRRLPDTTLEFRSTYRDCTSEAQEAVKAALALELRLRRRPARLLPDAPIAVSVHGIGSSPEHSQFAFEEDLATLRKWFLGQREQEDHRAVGTQQPFYFAYQEHNIVGPMSSYGDLCARSPLPPLAG